MDNKKKLVIFILVLGLYKVIGALKKRSIGLDFEELKKQFPMIKVKLMIQELNTQYTPYFIHYYQQLVNLKREYGQTNQIF